MCRRKNRISWGGRRGGGGGGRGGGGEGEQEVVGLCMHMPGGGGVVCTDKHVGGVVILL